MTLEIETVVAVSLMMAVFSAVAAVGTSLVLGAGFERLRCGFEVIRKQTGFFSDAIHKLEQKVEEVDKQSDNFTHSIHQLEAKVSNVGEQTNLFSETMQKMNKKIEVVDKQTAFFSNAIHKLEKQVDDVGVHEERIGEKMREHANVDLISTAKTEALVCRAEDLLTQMASIASEMQHKNAPAIEAVNEQPLELSIPKNLMHFVHSPETEDGQTSYH